MNGKQRSFGGSYSFAKPIKKFRQDPVSVTFKLNEDGKKEVRTRLNLELVLKTLKTQKEIKARKVK